MLYSLLRSELNLEAKSKDRGTIIISHWNLLCTKMTPRVMDLYHKLNSQEGAALGSTTFGAQNGGKIRKR